VGWTPPTVIYDKMRHIDSGVRELNVLLLVNVKSATLRAAWEAWYKNWQAFFEKYQGTFARLGAVFYTDDLAAQTEEYRRIYESFRASYAVERGDKGEPLPPPSAPIPAVLTPGDKRKEGESKDSGWSLPWWFWVLGGAAVTVGGYFLYKTVRQTVADTRAKKRALEGAVPGLLTASGVPSSVSHAAVVSGDPARLAPSGLYVDNDHAHTHPAVARVPHEAARYTHHARDAAGSHDEGFDE
jgi:hypothetical protein